MRQGISNRVISTDNMSDKNCVVVVHVAALKNMEQTRCIIRGSQEVPGAQISITT